MADAPARRIDLDRARRYALWRNLCARTRRFVDEGNHELEMLDWQLQGMEAGLDPYGPWNVEDGRDYLLELAKERRDGLNYLSAEAVRRKLAELRAIELRVDDLEDDEPEITVSPFEELLELPRNVRDGDAGGDGESGGERG